MIGRPTIGKATPSLPAVFLGNQLDDCRDGAGIIVSHSRVIVGSHKLISA
jgi:hypothetical protein